MNDHAISISSLNVEIDGVKILSDVTFNAQSGENITILGPNGAGKTTLLKSVCGFISYEGEVKFSGISTRLLSPQLRASKVSFVSQHSDIDGDFTVGTFLDLSRYPYKKPWERLDDIDRNIINEAIEMTECAPFLERKILSLSGGERQKVFIAAAIAQDTPVILLDEPLNHLDPVQRTKIGRLISEISGIKKKTVVTVTHEINEAIQFASRMIVLNKGKIEFDGLSSDPVFKQTLDTVFETEFISFKSGSNKPPYLFPGEII
jgi:iron complex transport system ATP-binding protein